MARHALVPDMAASFPLVLLALALAPASALSWPTACSFPYNMSGAACGALTHTPAGDTSAAACASACCSTEGCVVWQWTRAVNGGGCWMSPFRPNVPSTGCPSPESAGPWIGAAKMQQPPTPRPGPVPPPPSPHPPHPTPPWLPSRWTKKGAYDAVMCETTPFWWAPLGKIMLLESVCSGPWATGWKDPYGYYWGHEEQWDLDYANHSYFRIRHLDTGQVVLQCHCHCQMRCVPCHALCVSVSWS